MKNIFTFLMLFLGTATVFAQFSEDFEGDLSDWTIEDGWLVGTSVCVNFFFLLVSSRFVLT